MIAVNQTGVFLGLRECGRVMKEQGSGSIINISSVAGLGGVGIAHAYCGVEMGGPGHDEVGGARVRDGRGCASTRCTPGSSTPT